MSGMHHRLLLFAVPERYLLLQRYGLWLPSSCLLLDRDDVGDTRTQDHIKLSSSQGLGLVWIAHWLLQDGHSSVAAWQPNDSEMRRNGSRSHAALAACLKHCSKDRGAVDD